jgi:hypothetical protein
MTLTLGDVKDWHDGVWCVPTMLCAISGKTPDEIAVVLKEAAQDCGVVISDTLRHDYNINHWLRAIQRLSLNYVDLHDFSAIRYERRQTIDEYLANPTTGRLEMVFCEDPAAALTHVFATASGDVVDTYPCGKRIAHRGVPESHMGFRVKRVFLINHH